MIISGTSYTDPEEMRYRMMAKLIEEYKVRYPQDWNACMEYIKIKKANNKDRYGATGDESNRRSIASIPSHLNRLLETIDPDFDKGTKAKEFYRRFPVFLTVEKL